jgi:hypothetical protein
VPSGELEYGKKYRWNMQSRNSAGPSIVSRILYFQIPELNTDKFRIGDAVEVYNTANGLLVLDAACGQRIGGKFNGEEGTILEGPVYCGYPSGYNRWRVRWSDGLVGWSAENWLRRR